MEILIQLNLSNMSLGLTTVKKKGMSLLLSLSSRDSLSVLFSTLSARGFGLVVSHPSNQNAS